MSFKPLLVRWMLMLFWLPTVGAGELPELPDSLARWYKPENKRQVWLHTMFSLRRELQAVQEYAAAGDGKHLAKWTDRLAANYRKIGEMVPEWREELELEQADALEMAGRQADGDAAATAAKRLRRTCRSCHRDYRALAAARYRSPDFDTISVGEGETVLDYADAMESLSRSVNRIKIGIEDEGWQAASAALGNLAQQLQALQQTCAHCHQDRAPVERILGADSSHTLDTLEHALEAQDPHAAGRQLGAAAVQVCARCHGIHRTLSDLRHRLFR